VRFHEGGPAPVCVPQPEVEAVQRARLADGFDIVVEWGTALSGARQHTDHVEVELDGPGDRERVLAQWVVGCDGAHSRVREIAGIGFAGSTYPGTYVLGDGEVSGGEDTGVRTDEVHYTLHPEGVLVLVPLPGGGLRVFADATAAGGDPDAPLTAAQLQTVVDRRAPYPLTVGALRWSTRFAVHQRKVGEYRRGRLLLAGDAAHIHSPAGGQGMNTGVQDAANLGWKLAAVLRGAPEALLDSYGAERAPVADAVMRSSHLQTRMWNTRSALGRRTRDLLLGRLSAAGVLERRIVPMLAQDDLDHRRSPAVGERGGRRALGERVPDVTVVPVGADPVRLGALLAAEPRHVLLVWPGTDVVAAKAADTAVAGLADRVRLLVLVEDVERFADLPVAAVRGGYVPGGELAGCRAVLVRPDGYLAAAAADLDVEPLLAPLRSADAETTLSEMRNAK
jgi:3-(3-hydroxy-phenyl)propionate hydroxylase